MEFWIAFGVTFIIAMLIEIGKRSKAKEERKKPIVTTKAEAEHQRKLKQTDEELITVILPTINNDK